MEQQAASARVGKKEHTLSAFKTKRKGKQWSLKY
jgi:hypothetical protein